MTEIAPHPIGQIIRRARRELGISQYTLADRLATISGKPTIGRDRVARWERGRQVPRAEWRRWLSAVLNVPQEELDTGAVAARRHNRLGNVAGVAAPPEASNGSRRIQGTPALLPVFRSRVAAGILAAALLNPDRAFSLTELAEHAGASLASVSKEAHLLEAAGILSTRNDGAIRLTQAATDRPMLGPLTELIRVTYGVPQVIAEEFGKLPGVARIALTGAWAERFAGIAGPEPATIQVRITVGSTATRPNMLVGAARRAELRLKRPVRYRLVSPERPTVDGRSKHAGRSSSGERAPLVTRQQLPSQRRRSPVVQVRPITPPDEQPLVAASPPKGGDVISRFVEDGQLELFSGPAAVGAPYFDLASHHLVAAEHVASIAPGSAFVLVCNAAQLVGTGLLAGQGLRPAAGADPAVVAQTVVAEFGSQFSHIELLRRRQLGLNYPTGRDNRATADDVEAYLPTVRSMLKDARSLVPELSMFA